MIFKDGVDFMNKGTAILLSVTMLFLGIIVGFLFSPVKGGVNIGNNSGNEYKKMTDDNNESDITV